VAVVAGVQLRGKDRLAEVARRGHKHRARAHLARCRPGLVCVGCICQPRKARGVEARYPQRTGCRARVLLHGRSVVDQRRHLVEVVAGAGQLLQVIEAPLQLSPACQRVRL
jgi:hypothetical protein